MKQICLFILFKKKYSVPVVWLGEKQGKNIILCKDKTKKVSYCHIRTYGINSDGTRTRNLQLLK